jgi:CheY-specific phosphatase CheX
MEYIKTHRVKVGLIAENEGLLSRQQADELNYLQMHSDKKFGDLAIEKGYLTESDITYLLGLQGNPYLIYVQALEDSGILTRDEIADALVDFKNDNNYSDEILNAIKTGDIDTILPTLVDTENPRYLELIGLTLRNIVRFVNTYLRMGKASFVNSLSAKYLAFQCTEGDYEGFLGFCSDSDNILAIADGYAKEKFDAVDEDSLDAVAEFINCVNGLYAAELSYQNIKIDMLPPVLQFDGTISRDDTFCVLPVYIESKKIDLVIKIA